MQTYQVDVVYQDGGRAVRTEHLLGVTGWSESPVGFLRFSLGSGDEFLVAAGAVLTIDVRGEEDPFPGSGCPTCGG